MMKANLAWLPCTYPQEDGSTRYAAIELVDDRMASPIILQMPEHLYCFAGGNDILKSVLSEVVARVNRSDSMSNATPCMLMSAAANEH